MVGSFAPLGLPKSLKPLARRTGHVLANAAPPRAHRGTHPGVARRGTRVVVVPSTQVLS